MRIITQPIRPLLPAFLYCGVIALASAAALGVEPVTIDSLLREMVCRESIARFPEQDFRLKQASSYNRASKTPDDPQGWFANGDLNKGPSSKNFIRTERNSQGEKEWVLMNHAGAGAIVRTWMPWHSQSKPGSTITMRIYLDGASEPTLEGNMLGMFDGTGLIPYPFAHPSLRSAVNFFPIPYAKSCKVTTTEMPFFFQFTFREYAEGTPVETFTMEAFEAAKGLSEEVGKTLLNPQADSAGEPLAFCAKLAPAEEKSLTLPDGVASVRELSVRLNSYAKANVTRQVVLKMEFDGKETVWCPIGDFFGSGIGLNPHQGWYRTVAEDGAMSCRWVMPYQKGGKVSLLNLSREPVDAELSVKTGKWSWDERSMYFHAGWRGQYPVATRPRSDWNYVTLKGRGVYVGDTLTIMNPEADWWGEGDEKIWVDGEDFPSIFGTGTEDYYAYSWGGRSTDFYEHPFHAQPFCHRYNKLNRKMGDERGTLGFSTETRTRALDTMPFGRSLQLDMEVWANTEQGMGYQVGTYWYGFGETTSNRKPDADETLNVPPLPEMTKTAQTRKRSRKKGPKPRPANLAPANPAPAKSNADLAASMPQKQPNIVLLISDDDDYEHFGFMGSKIAQTPTLDALAKAGTVFTTAHCPAPLCRPSLASILSGRLPHQHGIYANYLENRKIGADRVKLDPAGSLPNRLKEAGYATYATAKYWEGDPRTMGFTHGTVDVTFKGFGKFVRQDQNELFDFIDEQHKAKPMFIWWAPLLPHKPHNPPAKYAERFADVKIPIPSYLKGDPKQYVAAMRKFYAMGAWFDDGVAQLVQKLKDTGEYENTVFLFYVDNGYCFGMPAKNAPTEKGLRTPMFVTWPGHADIVPAGKRIDWPSRAIDLHATALDYAGVKPAQGIASRSLRPQIEGTEANTNDAVYGAVFAHVPAVYRGQEKRSAERDVYALYARTERWKYVLYTQDIGRGNDPYIRMVHELSDAFTRQMGDENLYDLNADPYEANDLSSQAAQKERLTEFRVQVLDWWKRTGGGPLRVAASEQTSSVRAQRTVRPQNVLIIMADDLGYADLGCYGCKDIRTPHIDSLAQHGARFTSAYATGSMCGPSRAGFITGRFQSSFGWYSNPAQPLDPKQGMPPKTKTVAQFMQQQGYVTGGVGKWHMGTADHQHPNALGYSDWFGFLGGGLTYYPLDHPSYNGRYETLMRPWGVRDLHHTLPVLHNRKPVQWKQYLTRELTDAGVAFIERNGEQPFFLFMSYNAPHLELEAPDETIAKYPEGSMAEVPGVSARSRSIYAAMVDEMDQGIGRLLESLDKQGLAENTVVWFLSDHGGMKRTSDNRPLRGAKGSDYEGGLRVPLIVRWPGKVKPGTVLQHPVTSLDIGATSLATAGGDPAKAGLHGVDITSYVDGQKSNAPHQALYWRTAPPKQESGIVREGDFKLLIRRGKIELFNLQQDISESNNVASRQPELVKRLHAHWKVWDKSSQPALWQTARKSEHQYADYEWLKGNPNYRAKPE